MSDIIDTNKYKELQSKYNKTTKENKKLKRTLDLLTDNIENFKTSYNSITIMFNEMQETIKNLQNQNNNMNNNKSMKNLASERTSKVATAPQSEEVIIGSYSPKGQNFYSKKIDDLEGYSSEMTNSFNNLVSKYKLLKEEKDKIKLDLANQIEETQNIKENFEKFNLKEKEKKDSNNNLKEIIKALMDSNLSALHLGINNESINLKNNNNSSSNNLCEPVPSFINFLNKY